MSTSPLVVLQVIDSLTLAGAEQSLVALAPHLMSRGAEVHVAYLVERPELRGALEALGVPVTSHASVDAGRRDWLTRLSHQVAQLRPHLVHTTLFEADLAGRRAAARAGVPCVSSLVNTAYGRDEARTGEVSLLKLRAAQLADAATAQRVRRFHAVTDHVADVMSRRLAVPRRRMVVVPRGRDAELLGRRSPERRARVRASLGVEPATPLILAVGRHEPQKGFESLLRALPLVLRRVPDARLVVAGRPGRATAELQALASELGAQARITWLGAREDVPDLLAAGDVLAFPSLWEGAGGTLLEAMALECPIVTSDLPTLREAVDGSTALLVPPAEPAALAAAVVEVLAGPEAARARAVRGRVRFERDYTIESSADGMMALYRSVTGPAPGSTAPRRRPWRARPATTARPARPG